MSVDFDLFGEAIPAHRGKRGRPPHLFTVENLNKLMLLAATNGALEDGCRLLGISEPTLRKYYFRAVEVWETAALKLRIRLLSAWLAEVEKGNVAAGKELMKAIDKGQIALLAERVADRGKTDPKLPKLGKKEQQREAAGNVAGLYSPRTPPHQRMN